MTCVSMTGDLYPCHEKCPMPDSNEIVKKW